MLLTLALLLMAFGFVETDKSKPTCASRQLFLEADPLQEPRTQLPTELKVSSLNLNQQGLAALVEGPDRFDHLENFDLLLLQQVGDSFEQAEGVARLHNWNLFYAVVDPTEKGSGGLALVSTWPLQDPKVHALKEFNLVYNSRCRLGVSARLQVVAETLHVFNAHLDTRINAKGRLEQLRPLVSEAAAFGGPALVGGDFNTADYYWVYHSLPIPFLQRQGKSIRKLFEREGFYTPFEGQGPTHDKMRLKLDWIFFKGVQTQASGIQPIDFSDHHLMWATLDFPVTN